ncbi:MAG TPA: 2,3-bisphosphoglycerate-independent phosphoglycerate mutase, partial [Candidatus Saccharimonadales bacterium]
VVSQHGLRQYHVAETEKYAHVTYFLNGGAEESFPGEDRSLIPSLKVATYDLAPDMKAHEIADDVIEKIATGTYDLIAVNFANADMVGHTGVFEAAKQAITTLDACLGRVIDATLQASGAALMTADHGNAEIELDPQTGGVVTSHTTSPVPVLLCGSDAHALRDGGGLSDIAPTALAVMGLPVPEAMTGTSLIAS